MSERDEMRRLIDVIEKGAASKINSILKGVLAQKIFLLRKILGKYLYI